MKTLLALVLAATMTGAPDPVREYRIDAGHTDVSFSIGFLGHPVRGRFDDVRGTISYAPGNPSASGISVVIATRSISTGSAHRDEHLRSPDFFDASRYPMMVFRTESIASRAGALIATGPLTMHGATRTVTIPFRETQPAFADPHGSNLVFFSGRLRLARKDFGILGGSKYNDWFDELRSATMADSVDIELEVTGWDPDPARTKTYDATIQRIEQSGMSAVLARVGSAPVDSLRSDLYDIEQLARALQARGKSGEAIVLLKTVTDRLDGVASLHSALGRLYEVSGDAKGAKAQAARALAIDSLDTRALELRRRLATS
jgi:polyisoprenoid-binding protein YceI